MSNEGYGMDIKSTCIEGKTVTAGLFSGIKFQLFAAASSLITITGGVVISYAISS
jgi:hypothetical protein